jgi:hypothetical protein
MTGAPKIEIGKINFGQITVDSTSNEVVRELRNNGDLTLTITGATGPANAAVYSVVRCGTSGSDPKFEEISPSNPLIIEAGKYKKIGVKFAPSGVGEFADQIEFISDADTSYYKHDSILELIGVGIEHLVAPTLIAPANASTNISITPIFEWGTVAAAEKYNIEVSTNSTFDTTVFHKIVTNGTYTATTALDNETVYYWRVNAMNDNETSDWSETWSFTTEPSNAVNDENVLAGSDIKIIPNPANENITIVADFILTSAKIYDLAGNLVLEANTHNIDISQLPHGAYVIVIETKHKTERATFIKE